MADTGAIKKARDIVTSDVSRSFVVVSAPGKCAEFPYKVTDLLIEYYAGQDSKLDIVLQRFEELSGGLIEAEIERTREEILINRKNYDFVVSRGEYLMAILFAKMLDYKFIDAAKLIVIKNNGKYQEMKIKYISRMEKYVMGGFYGSDVNGHIKAFPRGGSDYTGAIVAVSLRANMYEIFTDTYGVQTANPAIVRKTKTIPELDFGTMYKLSIAGASVIYPECLPLLKRFGVPLRVDNTFEHGKSSTIIHGKNSRFFCITYTFKQNINKDMVEIYIAFNGYRPQIVDIDKEVYLIENGRNHMKLICKIEDYKSVVRVLHNYFLQF